MLDLAPPDDVTVHVGMVHAEISGDQKDGRLPRLANILPTYGWFVGYCWVPVGVEFAAYDLMAGFVGLLQGRSRGFESLRAHRCSPWSRH